MTAERGLEYLNNGWADLISFGRLYISNPDLAERLINNQQLNTSLDFYTLFSNFNPKGYTDYPFYD
jgi:N-ethylmaleimide reductase